MGTKRPSCTLFDTLSNPNTADRKHQPGGQFSRDPSPRPGTAAQSERERERNREEEWRREREMERMRDKTRYKGKDMDPREKYSERDRAPAPRPREGERERRDRERRQEEERNRNGRPLSNLEKGSEREIERIRKKGDTFPRTRRGSQERDRRMTAFTEKDEERGGKRILDKQKRIEIDDFETEREKAWRRERQREGERYRERERDGFRNNGGKPMEDGTVRQRERLRESDPDFRERRRARDLEVIDLWDRREWDAARQREKPRPNLGERETRMPSPRRRRDREIYSDRKDREKAERRDGKRDTKSEGDSDETEMRKERVKGRAREELMYRHSRSEGDNNGKTARENERDRQRYREEDKQRYREREREREADGSGVRDKGRERGAEKAREMYREKDRRKGREFDREGERWKDGVRDVKGCRQDDRGWPSDRREGDRYREREDEERRGRERKERETDLRWDDAAGRGRRSLSEMAPRPPPGAQSSGEWSSDMDSERRHRRGRDSYEERESGRDSTAESERDVEEERSGGTAAERSRRQQKRSETPDRGEERTGGAPEQRRMWLEPHRGKNSKDSSVEDEFVERERHTRRKERKRGGEERTMESQTEWGREGRRVKEEQDERYSDQSKSSGRHCETGRHGRRVENMEQRGETDRTEGISVDGEEVSEAWRERDKGGKEHLSDSDGGIEGRERENVTDNTEESDREEEGGSDYCARSESEGGSETGWEPERDKMLSGEDGFVTVSSGDGEDEREEEEFEDCREFWEGGVSYDDSPPAGFKRYEGEEEREEDWREGKEDRVDKEGEDGEGQGKEKHPKYVFCVIGQTLPRSKPNKMSEPDQMGGAERDNPNSGSSQYGSDDITQQPQDDLHPVLSRNDDYPINNNNNQETETKRESDKYNVPKEERPDANETSRVHIRYRTSSEFEDTETGEGVKGKVEHPYAEIGPIGRDSLTEKLLTEWRERNKDYTGQTGRERERLSPSPCNPYGEVGSQGNFLPIQTALDGINLATMSPEEEVAIRIRMSGAWSMTEEAKRHSQAPHLKWAKNVVQEILGASEENAIDDPNSGQQGHREINQSERGIKKEEREEEMTEGTGEMPVYAKVQKLRTDEQHSELDLDEGEAEPLEVEELRDDEDAKSESWGEVDLRSVLDTIGRRKRNSKFFNAAQLYQQYSEAAQNIEILRQSRSDVLSTCEEHSGHLIAPLPSSSPSSSPAPSPPPARRPLPPLPPVPHPHSLSHTGSITSTTSSKSLPLPEPPKTEGRPSSPRLSISLTQSATLWRDLPGVRNSAELEELTEDRRRLQEVRFEVVTSEASYCRSLDIVVEHFVKSKQLGALLTTQDRNWLFSRLADVRAISHSFLSKLEERVDSDMMQFTVCDIIARHCQRFKMVYVPYLTNQSYQDATYQRLMNENPGFKRIVEKLERSPVCQRLPLRSFLVLPFQRITRIKLLVQNIVKRTAPGTEEVMQAIKALKLLEKLIQESNDSISQMKSIESLVSLSAKVEFECRTLPLISQSRRLVREGLVTELMDFSLKETERNVYLHLFNDYLLLSLHKEGGRFTVIDHAPVSDLRAENCRVKLHSLQKNLFRLHLSNKALLLRTDTQSDKLRWISAVSRPHPEIDFSAAQDFKQMQCIRAFVAQQPDELSLEKADIILVHQQSSDGWVEGTRLSDRHRGWMPESHLETITNPRVQQRNLSDALKLTTATAAV
ncbi:trichohyalin isoform X2 [Centroberyx affinis]|uniref:trichohyalin isoform X2 n=1 Tax=Centroberyx affinis TaxID=166261 RepID=UPI003A5C26CD